jgi:hypothetical protein
MKTYWITVTVACIAACSNPTETPVDAKVVTMPDSRPADTFMPDAFVPTTCPVGQVCLKMVPIDGVTTLPAGRLAIAWVVENSQTAEVALDVPWTPAPVTMVDLSQVALPTASFRTAFPGTCATTFAPALAVLSTDPDHSNSITSAEIMAGFNDHTVYGLHQEIVAWFEATCPADPPNFPEGFTAGIHVYTEASPVHHLDGKVTDMQTCAPTTMACENLNNPL